MIEHLQTLTVRFPIATIFSWLGIGTVTGVSGFEVADIVAGLVLKIVSIIALTLAAAVSAQTLYRRSRERVKVTTKNPTETL